MVKKVIMLRLNHWVKTKIFALILVVLMAVAGGTLNRLSLAAPGQIYISAASTSVQNGANFSVAVRINPGGPVDSVDVTLGYDAAKLQFVSIDSSGSNFPASVLENGGGGSVRIVRFIGGSTVNTDALISRVNFKALTGSGSTTLNLAGSNAAYTGAYTNPSLSNGTVNFTTPATPAPPPSPTPAPPATTPRSTTPSPSTPRTTTPSPSQPATPAPSSPTPAPAPAANQPTCSTTVSSVRFNSASLHITCNPAARVFVKFGNEGKLIESTQPSPNPITEADIQLNGVTVKPGSSISFATVVINSSNQQTEMAAQTFTTKGYSLKVKVLGKDKRPLANRQFVLRSTPLTAKSDKSGVLNFTNVSPGQHSLELTGTKTKQIQSLTVQDNVQTASDGSQTAAVQNFSLIYPGVSGSKPWLWWGLSLLGLILLAILGGWFIMKPKRPNIFRKNDNLMQSGLNPPLSHSASSSPSPAVIEPTTIQPPNPQSSPQKPRPITPTISPTPDLIKQAPVITPTRARLNSPDIKKNERFP